MGFKLSKRTSAEAEEAGLNYRVKWVVYQCYVVQCLQETKAYKEQRSRENQ